MSAAHSLRNFPPLVGKPTLCSIERGERKKESRRKKLKGVPCKSNREREREREEREQKRGETARVAETAGDEAPLVSFRFLIRTSFGTLGFK